MTRLPHTPTIPSRPKLSSKPKKPDHPFRDLLKLANMPNGKGIRSLSLYASRLLWAYIIHTNQKTGICWPSRKTLSQISGIAEDNLSRPRQELIDAGILEIVRNGTRGKSAIVKIPLLIKEPIPFSGECNQQIPFSTECQPNATAFPTECRTMNEKRTKKHPNHEGGNGISFSSLRKETKDFPSEYYSTLVTSFTVIGVKQPFLIQKLIEDHPVLAPLYAVQLHRKRQKSNNRREFGNTAAAYLKYPYGENLKSKPPEVEIEGRYLDDDLAKYRDEEKIMKLATFRFKLDRVYNSQVSRHDYD